MDRKREMTSVDLVALVAELRTYTGAVVDKAYLYDTDLVRLKLRDFDRGRLELFIEVGQTKRAHLIQPEHVPNAPGRPPDFAKMLRNRISGAEFAAVSQHGFDRILEFEFRREDQDTRIVAELFGEGNLAVLDQSGSVVDCLQTIRLSSRTVAPGAQYGFPTERPRPDTLSREDFEARFRQSDTDVVRTLATQLDFGGLYGEELCTRAGVEKTRDVADVTAAEIDDLYGTIDRLLGPLEDGDVDPRVYAEEGVRVDVTPVPLQEYADLDADSFETFTEALDDYYTNLEAEEGPGAGEPERPDFEEQIATKERIIAQQEEAIEDFAAAAEEERARAETLYAHYDTVDEVLRTVSAARAEGHGWEDIEAGLAEGAERGIDAASVVTGIDPSEGMVTLSLGDTRVAVDPDHGVEKNADRLYTEAKRIEEKREGAIEAVEETRAELERVKDQKASWTPADVDDDEGSEGEQDWLTMASVPIRQTDRWHDRFRWVRTSDGFLVIGGRNADQNEEIVEKYLDRHDLFFHTQAHGGPATVLKTSDPSEPSRDIDVPETSLHEAAQFAVTYSSVWKDGRLAGDVYQVDAEQVSKTPESGEYLEKGGFAIRGDRTYHRDTPVGCVVGLACEPETRVLGGPPSAVQDHIEVGVRLEPGEFAQGDVGKRVYRRFRDAFEDTSMVRSVASPDEIQKFMPPGTSQIAESIDIDSTG